MQYVGFIPCRSGSVRVPNKNTKSFSGSAEGLIGRKLRQMCSVRQFSDIIISTDDQLVKNICDDIRSELSDNRIMILHRPAELAASGTTLDDFVRYVSHLRDEGVLFWTHVTSPFFDANHMVSAISEYENNVLNGEYDSLMGVTPIRDYFWRNGECISHDRRSVKWPQTQDIAPFYEVNSSAFLYEIQAMRKDEDRIGVNPFLFQVDKKAGFDVDWPEDFEIAELMAHAEELRMRLNAF